MSNAYEKPQTHFKKGAYNIIVLNGEKVEREYFFLWMLSCFCIQICIVFNNAMHTHSTQTQKTSFHSILWKKPKQNRMTTWTCLSTLLSQFEVDRNTKARKTTNKESRTTYRRQTDKATNRKYKQNRKYNKQTRQQTHKDKRILLKHSTYLDGCSDRQRERIRHRKTSIKKEKTFIQLGMVQCLKYKNTKNIEIC